MDWTGPNKRKLRQALVTIYSTPKKLAKFVSDELDVNLNLISNEAGLDERAFDLIEEGCAEGGWINLLYEKLCEENTSHPAVVKLQSEIEKPLIKKSAKLAETDWQELFSRFSFQDFAYVQIAFFRAFEAVHNNPFWDVRPDNPPLVRIEEVRKLLEDFDKPDLAVRFVEFVVIEFQRSGERNRDLAPLAQWRDRIAQTYQVALQGTEPVSQTRQGYLLVSLQPSGRQTQKKGAFVNLFAELQVAGEASPIEFGACSITCPLKEVANHLSTLIQKAEVALIPYECSEVAIELFLPCCHLEENVAIWQVKNEQERLRLLGTHRRFLVRSFERAANPTKRVAVSQKWQLLKSCMAEGKVYSRFHCQTVCPNPGDLEALLSDKPGLRLLAALPDDLEHRADIFYDIINSAVPIALWCSQTDGCSVDDLEAQFNQLLEDSRLTDFAHLAQQWRSRRVEPENVAVKHIRLLCDCPDRWPSLPSPTQEDDLLVAS